CDLINHLDLRDQVVNAPRVDRNPEGDLGFCLVTFGDGNVAHVVTETSHLHRPQLVPACCCPGPGSDFAAHLRVAGMSCDGLACYSHSSGDVAELPVTVSCLVEVHEVHVDARPWQCAVGLGVQVQQRLAELL